MYHRLPGSKSDYGKGAQTAVSFAAGYLAGILCAIVSHPADVMVSKLNANREAGESFGAATGRIYKDIGFRGLWSGLPIRIVMIGTLTGTYSGDRRRHARTKLGPWYMTSKILTNFPPRTAVDDLRFLQDLHGFPDHRRCSSRKGQGLKACSHDRYLNICCVFEAAILDCRFPSCTLSFTRIYPSRRVAAFLNDT